MKWGGGEGEGRIGGEGKGGGEGGRLEGMLGTVKFLVPSEGVDVDVNDVNDVNDGLLYKCEGGNLFILYLFILLIDNLST